MGGRAWTSQVSRCKLTEPGRARGPRVAARRQSPLTSRRFDLRASLPPPEGMVAAETGAPRASPRDATRTRYRSNTTIDVGMSDVCVRVPADSAIVPIAAIPPTARRAFRPRPGLPGPGGGRFSIEPERYRSVRRRTIKVETRIVRDGVEPWLSRSIPGS